MITIDIAIKRFNDKAEHELTLGNLRGCLEFRQLAEWLEKYKKIEHIVKAEIPYKLVEIEKVVKDGNDENVLVGCIGCKYSGVSKHAVCNSCVNMSRYEQEVVKDGNVD